MRMKTLPSDASRLQTSSRTSGCRLSCGRTLSLAVYVRDTEPRVSGDKVDVDLVDPTIIFERHPIRIVFEDGRATILSDIERFIDRIDERNRVVDSGFSDFGLIRAELSRSSNRA